MRHLMPLIAAVALVLSTVPAHADLGDQLFKLLPDDGASGDLFGYSVAISGTIAIVGVWADDENGTASGSAYLFDTATGQQLFKFLPDDGAENDNFGSSVAISGTTAIVGSDNDDNSSPGSGSAYIFDAATGQQLAKILSSDGATGDNFGVAVAISGTVAIVGASWATDDGEATGAAYVFEMPDGGWVSMTETAKLLPNDGTANDGFGRSVAISGTTAVVGARHGVGNESNSGSAYLFNTSTGEQIAKLLADDGTESDRFGHSVAISGDVAIVGAAFDDENGIHSGSAYLFDATTGDQLFKFLPNYGEAGDYFGYSVSIDGTTAIAGAILSNGSHSGSAYLFDIATGGQIAELLADDGETNDWFGFSVAISGTAAIVGAREDDDLGNRSGSAYLFDASMCTADFNGDGNVGAFDLAIVLGFWGPNRGHPADLDGDGVVGPFDLALLLGNWGPCP